MINNPISFPWCGRQRQAQLLPFLGVPRALRPMWWGKARTSWLAAKWPWSRRNASRTNCSHFHSWFFILVIAVILSLKSSCVATGHVCPLWCGWRWLFVEAGGHTIRSRQGMQFICRVYLQETKVAWTNAHPDFFQNLNEYRWIWIHASGVLHGSLTGSECCHYHPLPTDCILMVESWHWPKIVADPASKDRLWRNLVTPGSILRWNCMDWQFSGSIIFANFWHLHGFQCFRTVLLKKSICIYWVIWVCSLRQSRHRLWLLPADEGDHWRRPCHREGAESFASPIWEILRSSHLRSRREEKLKAPRLSMLLKSLDFISRQDAPAYFITFQDVWMSLNVSISLNTYLHFAQMLQWALGCQHVTRQPPLWMETRAELLMECAYK